MWNGGHFVRGCSGGGGQLMIEIMTYNLSCHHLNHIYHKKEPKVLKRSIEFPGKFGYQLKISLNISSVHNLTENSLISWQYIRPSLVQIMACCLFSELDYIHFVWKLLYFAQNVYENRSKIPQFFIQKINIKMSSAKWWPSCLSLNMLMICPWDWSCQLPLLQHGRRNNTHCWHCMYHCILNRWGVIAPSRAVNTQDCYKNVNWKVML